jgi:hypothetical protein
MRPIIYASTLLLIIFGASCTRHQSEAERKAQLEKDIQNIEMRIVEGTGTDCNTKPKCACVPNNCCCGPPGKPCTWCGANPNSPRCNPGQSR